MDEIKVAYDEDAIPYLLEATGSKAKYLIDLTVRDSAMMPRRWKTGHACCPICERGVVKPEKYCCHCGQAIDW